MARALLLAGATRERGRPFLQRQVSRGRTAGPVGAEGGASAGGGLGLQRARLGRVQGPERDRDHARRGRVARAAERPGPAAAALVAQSSKRRAANARSSGAPDATRGAPPRARARPARGGRTPGRAARGATRARAAPPPARTPWPRKAFVAPLTPVAARQDDARVGDGAVLVGRVAAEDGACDLRTDPRREPDRVEAESGGGASVRPVDPPRGAAG